MPNVKFMVVLRDPADRAYSEFNMVRTRCKGGHQMCSWVHSDFYDYAVRGVSNLRLRGCTFNNGKLTCMCGLLCDVSRGSRDG